MFKNLIQYFQNNGDQFAIFFIFLATYGIFKVLFFLPQFIFNRASAKNPLPIVGAITLIVAVILGIFLFINLSVEKINITGIDDAVARNNDILVDLDKRIFGVYVPFWFENSENPLNPFFSNLSVVFIEAYKNLTMVIAFSMIIALIMNSGLFIKILGNYALTMAICLFLWFIFPVTSPMDAYVDRIPKPLNNPGLEHYLTTYQSGLIVENFDNTIREIRDSMGGKLWVTTMPSMHIIWSVIVLYTVANISRYLLLVMIPFFVLNFISTMFTLQHYAIDTIVGLAIAVLSIGIIDSMPRLKVSSIDFLSSSIREDLYSFGRLFKL